MKVFLHKPAAFLANPANCLNPGLALGLTFLFPALVLSGYAQSPEAKKPSLNPAIAETRKDIRQATEAVNSLHSAISAERIEMAREIAQLLNTTRELTARRRSLEKRKAELTEATADLSRHTASREKELQRISDLILEYRQVFGTKLTAATAELYRDRLTDIDTALPQTPGQLSGRAIEKMLDLSGRHLQKSVGPHVFTGRAQDTGGQLVEGSYAEYGPVAYFQGHAENAPAGLVMAQPDSLIPGLIQPSKNTPRQVRVLFDEGASSLPFDPTLGTAHKLQLTEDNLWGHLRKGRTVIIPLLLLGLFCAGIAVHKFIQLAKLTSPRSMQSMETVLRLIQKNQAAAAYREAESLHKPLRAVIQEGIRHWEAPKERLEEIMYEKLISQTPALEKFLAPLAVCASAAPLLGLLGTVTGMIHTFRLITVFGAGNAQMLSSGISEALITTEVGLVIAVPALLVHAYLSRRVRRAVSLTQQAAVTFVNRLTLQTEDSSEAEDA